MEEPYLFQLVNIAKTFYPASGPVNVLQSLNLCIKPGEKVAIEGPSGSGKTTLLNIMAAIDKPDQGDIYFKSARLTEYNASDLAMFRNKNIGMIFQNHYLLPQCTALENVMLPTIPLNTPAKKAQDRALDLLEKMDLGQRAHHFPAQLSGGESQRVAVARSLINDPDLILADEPTGLLDRQSALLVMDLLETSMGMGKTLVIVTHTDFVANRMALRFQLQEGILTRQGGAY